MCMIVGWRSWQFALIQHATLNVVVVEVAVCAVVNTLLQGRILEVMWWMGGFVKLPILCGLLGRFDWQLLWVLCVQTTQFLGCLYTFCASLGTAGVFPGACM